MNNSVFEFILAQQRKEICGDCKCSVDMTKCESVCPFGKWGAAKIVSNKVFNINTVNSNHDEKPPTALNKARSFGYALFKEAKQTLLGEPKIKKEEANQRIKICESCEFFDKRMAQCKKCGCFLKLKTLMRSQHCPIGKW
jgi:hypothetical protein